MYQTKGHTSLKKTASQAEPPFVPRELVILFKIVKTLNRFFFLFFLLNRVFPGSEWALWGGTIVECRLTLCYFI